jgi:hypothetical protein
MNESFGVNCLKDINGNIDREKLVNHLENQIIDRNNENKKKRKFECLWERNKRKLLRNSVSFDHILCIFIE